ncbi:Uncharacterised protein [Segatella copri]|nr:Uncharacterised protein [Segatella copri]
MNAKLGCYIFDILWLRCNTMPVHIAFWVYIYLVGNRSQIISTL